MDAVLADLRSVVVPLAHLLSPPRETICAPNDSSSLV
jgi:hypothetical protein